MRSHHIHSLRVTNFRSLAAFDLSFGEINVFFGPNGAGKSSLLDALLFLRDCAVRGVDQASAERDQGVGMLWDKAAPDARIEFEITTEIARYVLSVGLTGGRIEPRAAERLSSKTGTNYLFRGVGSDKVFLENPSDRQINPRTGRSFDCRELSLLHPERLGLENHRMVHPDVAEVRSVDEGLRAIKRFACRDFAFRELKRIPTEFERKVTLQTGQWLRKDPHCFVLLIDDLEHSRAPVAQEVFVYYRSALDKALGGDAGLKRRAAVHFLVNMLEAYYFAHPEAVNQVPGTSLTEPTDDVEKIRHPKNDLKNLRVGFDEREHGEAIVAQLDLDKVLDAPGTCRSLRTLVAWCVHRLGGEFSTRWRLSDGEFHPLTCGQIPSPPSPPRDHAPPRRAG